MTRSTIAAGTAFPSRRRVAKVVRLLRGVPHDPHALPADDVAAVVVGEGDGFLRHHRQVARLVVRREEGLAVVALVDVLPAAAALGRKARRLHHRDEECRRSDHERHPLGLDEIERAFRVPTGHEDRAERDDSGSVIPFSSPEMCAAGAGIEHAVVDRAFVFRLHLHGFVPSVPCVCTTPLGRPLDPDVKSTAARAAWVGPARCVPVRRR